MFNRPLCKKRNVSFHNRWTTICFLMSFSLNPFKCYLPRYTIYMYIVFSKLIQKDTLNSEIVSLKPILKLRVGLSVYTFQITILTFLTNPLTLKTINYLKQKEDVTTLKKDVKSI